MELSCYENAANTSEFTDACFLTIPSVEKEETQLL